MERLIGSGVSYNTHVKRFLTMIAMVFLSLSVTAGGMTFADGFGDAKKTDIERNSGFQSGKDMPVKMQSLAFHYKKDAQVRYLDLKTRWQAGRMGEITMAEAAPLADEADRQASVAAPLTIWRYHGGPAPNVFGVKIHVYNTDANALLNVPFTTRLRVRLGDLRVKPDIQMTDYDTLERSARWLPAGEHTVTVAALAPGEDLLVDLIRFNLPDFLARHPHQWPVEIEARVTSPRMAPAAHSIRLIPDHFVVPVLY